MSVICVTDILLPLYLTFSIYCLWYILINKIWHFVKLIFLFIQKSCEIIGENENLFSCSYSSAHLGLEPKALCKPLSISYDFGLHGISDNFLLYMVGKVSEWEKLHMESEDDCWDTSQEQTKRQRKQRWWTQFSYFMLGFAVSKKLDIQKSELKSSTSGGYYSYYQYKRLFLLKRIHGKMPTACFLF